MVHPSVLEDSPTSISSTARSIWTSIDTCPYNHKEEFPWAGTNAETENRGVVQRVRLLIQPFLSSASFHSSWSAGHKSHADHISQTRKISDFWQHPVSQRSTCRGLYSYIVNSLHIITSRFKILELISQERKLTPLNYWRRAKSGCHGQPSNRRIMLYSLSHLQILCIRSQSKQSSDEIAKVNIVELLNVIGPQSPLISAANRSAILAKDTCDTPETARDNHLHHCHHLTR